MRLSFNFTVILAALLCTLSFSDAVPVARAPVPITFPLRALAQKRSDIHPLLLHQQHVNRALKRRALMSGTPMPTDLQLRQNLEKRLYILGENAAPLARANVGKRLYKDPKTDAILAKLRKPHARDLTSDIIGELEGLLGNSTELSEIIPILEGLLTSNDTLSELAGLLTNLLHRKHSGNSGGDPSSGDDGSSVDPSGDGSSVDPSGNGSGDAPSGDGSGDDPSGDGSGDVPSSGGDPSSSATPSSSNSGATGDGPGFSSIALGALESDGLTPAITPTTASSLGLAIESDDTGYVATISIGTPPQNFNILMDSGSADFWVGSEQCTSTSGGGCGNHTFLGSQSSSTFKNTNKKFQITYGTGNVAGTSVTDDVTIAGLTLQGLTFGVADSESVDFSADTTPFDGLMGLAQSTLSAQGTATPVEALATAGLIPAAITSYKISRFQDEKNDGEITFGALDTSKFDPSTLVTVPNVNTAGFWEVDFSISVNGQDLGLTGRTAILDTGTTLIVAPPSDASAFHAQIAGATSDGQGNFIVPCTGTPAVSFTIGGTAFTIDPRDLIFAPVDPTDLTGQCQSSISAGQIGGPDEWLVGDVFLKNAYYSTDVQSNAISLAKLV